MKIEKKLECDEEAVMCYIFYGIPMNIWEKRK